MRYSSAENLKSWLNKYNIDFTTDYPDSAVEVFIQQAESEIDQYCGRIFSFRRVNEVLDGQGSATLVLKYNPVVCIDKIIARYYPLSVVRTFKDGDDYIIIDRKIGKVAIRPNFALQGAFPEGYSQYYSYIFPRGGNNINIQYYSGYCMIGGNKSFDEIGEKGFYDIMDYSIINEGGTDYVYFTLPFAIGNVGWNMLYGGDTHTIINNNSVWTMVSAASLKAKLSDFTPSYWYRLAYIPQQIQNATTMLSAANLLASIGGREDTIGGGGVISHSVGGFSESFGDLGKYGAQISQWRELAYNMLNMFATNNLTMGR